MAELVVVALGLAGLGFAGLHFGIGFGELVLHAEVAATGLLAVAGVVAHHLAEFEEVSDAAGLLELHVGVGAGTGDADVVPELLAQLRDLGDRLRQAFAGAGHAALVPHDFAELLVEAVDGAGAIDGEQPVGAGVDLFLGLLELGLVGLDRARLLGGEIVGDGGRDDEVAIGQALHQGGGTEAVRAVVGEVRLAQHVEAGDVGHQVVVHPEAAHRVVHGGVDLHRLLVGILAGDLVIHLEQVAVAGADRGLAEAVGRVAEVEEHPEAGLGHAESGVADFLGGAGRDVARGKVAERGIFALEEVVAVVFLDVGGLELAGADLGGDFGGLRHPDAAVVAERLGHQRQLRLVVAADRDAGRVDLGVAGIGEVGAAAGGSPGGGDVAAHRVGRKEEHVAVAAGGENHGVGRVGLDLAADHVADDDAFGVAVNEDDIEHLGPREHFHAALVNLFLQRLVAADEELLPGLAAGVESAGDLGAAERAVVEQAAVFAGEGDALGDALVDDVHRDFGEAVDIGLAGAEVTAFDGVVEEAADRVAVVLVVLRGVDAALGGDRVGAARAVLVAEALHLIAEFGQGGGSGPAGEAGADDDDAEFPLVRGIDQLGVHLVLGPLLLDRAGRDFAV